MKENIIVLNYICQNTNMGIIAIDSIMSNINNKKFCKILKMQKEEYTYINMESKKYINRLNGLLKDISFTTKLISKMSIKLKVGKETSVNQLSKMLIKGTNMGIIDITEKINNYKITDIKTKKLAKTLKQTLENNLNELKNYL